MIEEAAEAIAAGEPSDQHFRHLGLSENVGYIPNEIAIFHWDNDQQNHWV